MTYQIVVRFTIFTSLKILPLKTPYKRPSLTIIILERATHLNQSFDPLLDAHRVGQKTRCELPRSFADQFIMSHAFVGLHNPY